MSSQSSSSVLRGVGEWASCPSISGASSSMTARNDSPSMSTLSSTASNGTSPMLAGFLNAPASSQPWSAVKPK